MNFIEAMQDMKHGKICSSGSCLYQITNGRLMVQVLRQQSWSICQVNVTALINKKWEIYKQDEFYDKKVVIKTGCYVIEVDPNNHMLLSQCIECVSFAGFVYNIDGRTVVAGAPMLFSRHSSFNASYTVNDEVRTVLRPIAARFRSE